MNVIPSSRMQNGNNKNGKIRWPGASRQNLNNNNFMIVYKLHSFTHSVRGMPQTSASLLVYITISAVHLMYRQQREQRRANLSFAPVPVPWDCEVVPAQWLNINHVYHSAPPAEIFGAPYKVHHWLFSPLIVFWRPSP